MADRLRGRAAADLGCPSGDLRVVPTGMGGWHVTGCSASARYVCEHNVCVMEGPIAGRTAPDTTLTRDVGAWSCELTGASVSDAEHIAAAIHEHEPMLATCATRSFALAVNRGYEQVALLSVDTGRACVSDAFQAVAVQAAGDSTVRCARRTE